MKQFILILLFTISIPTLATAKKVGGLFGKSERIVKIKDLEAKGPNNEDVYLAYKTTGYYFFLGAYFSNDGYVLGIKEKFGSYYPLNENQLADFQKSGILPTPLPTYKIPVLDWLWGFSLWILLAVIILIFVFPSEGDVFKKGCKYYFGENTPVNYPKAFSFFTKAASKGYAPAQYNLGIMYFNGQGTAKNIQKAISNFMLASDQNYTSAQLQMGNLYFNGQDIPKDLNKALSFYKAACKNGNQDGCKMVGYLEKGVTG